MDLSLFDPISTPNFFQQNIYFIEKLGTDIRELAHCH